MQGPRFTSHLPDLSSLDLTSNNNTTRHRVHPPHPPPPRFDSTLSNDEYPKSPPSSDPPPPPPLNDPESTSFTSPPSFPQRVWSILKRHSSFIGPGVIASVAYLDPGNWSTDLQAGSTAGYAHLFVVLLAGLMALLFQILATRLGCVSDEDFASHCRIALHNRPGKYKMVYRWGLLYPLYVLCEIGIIFTDLAELLGSAIAINLLIPAIPLWACVLLTALDVLLILLLFNQYPTRTVTRSMRLFELLIGVLVLVVLGSFVALLIKVNPDWGMAFKGYVPSSGIVDNGAVYIGVGIIGATVMPHAFFIGSKMACMRRIPPSAYGEADVDRPEDDDDLYYKKKKDTDKNDENDSIEEEDVERIELNQIRRSRTRGGGDEVREDGRTMFIPSLHLPQPFRINGSSLAFLTSSSSENPSSTTRSSAMDEIAITEESLQEREEAQTHQNSSNSSSSKNLKKKKKSYPPEIPRPKPSLGCIKAHLGHAVFDVAGSLLGFALVVNSSILILAAAVFYYGDGRSSNPDGGGISDLFDAYDLVKQYLGQAFAYLFAIALLAAGQSASLTVTLSGQIIGEGFLRWRTKPWKRRLITRCIGIVPSLAVSIAVGRQGIDTLLVASQVALSIVLTFVLIPLIIFTSEHRVMALPDKNASSVVPPPTSSPLSENTTTPAFKSRIIPFLKTINPFRRRKLPPGCLATYANPPIVIWFCWMIWLLVGTANVYAMYTLAHGE